MARVEQLAHYDFWPATTVRDDRLAIIALGFNSTQRNTSPRLQVVANRLRTRIVAVQRPGTDTTHFDPSLRRALGSPTAFAIRCRLYAEQLRNEISGFDEYPTRLIEGSSGGGVLALGMVAARAQFATHLLIREGHNQRARADKPERQLRGAWRVIREQLPDIPYLDRDKPPAVASPFTTALPDHRSRREKISEALRGVATGYVEMRHWGISSCSILSQQLAREVAAERPQVAAMFIDYEHGLHGDMERARNLAEILPAMRGNAGAPLVSIVEPGLRHRALLNPWREAEDINDTFALTSKLDPIQQDPTY